MTVSEEILARCVGFSSAAHAADRLFNYKLPVEEQEWRSNNGFPQTIVVLYRDIYVPDRLVITELGTDQTTDGFEWNMHHLQEDGAVSRHAFACGRQNIRRGAPGQYPMSIDNIGPGYRPIKSGYKAERDVIDSIDTAIETPVRAFGAVLNVKGHGWWRAVGIRLFGQKVGKLNGKQDWKEEIQVSFAVYRPY